MRWQTAEGWGRYSAADMPHKFDILTEREKQVARLVCQDLHSKEISTALKIAVKTVESHRSNINRKLGIHGKMELLRMAVRLKFIKL